MSFAMSDSSTKRTPVQPRGQKVMGLQVQGAACLLIHGRLPAAERRPLSFAKRGRSTKRTPAQPRVSKRSVRARAAHCLFACIGLFAHSRPTPRGGATTEVIAMRGRSTKRTPAQPRVQNGLCVHVQRTACLPAWGCFHIHDRLHAVERRPKSLQCAAGARRARPCSREPRNGMYVCSFTADSPRWSDDRSHFLGVHG